MEEYAPIVKRSDKRPGSQRARDFLDVHTLVERLSLDLVSPKAIEMIREMFRLKRVSLELLNNIEKYREFHRQGFPAVQATVSPSFDLQKFDVYFDYVVALAKRVMDAEAATVA
jgi:hypothetical protein